MERERPATGTIAAEAVMPIRRRTFLEIGATSAATALVGCTPPLDARAPTGPDGKKNNTPTTDRNSAHAWNERHIAATPAVRASRTDALSIGEREPSYLSRRGRGAFDLFAFLRIDELRAASILYVRRRYERIEMRSAPQPRQRQQDVSEADRRSPSEAP